MKWIGLTGGIATGKSTVARLVESRGFKVIDADRVSHQVTAVGEDGYTEILKQFGENVLDQQLKIDRKKLAEIVFNNSDQKKKLESILHPLIQEKVQEAKQKEFDNKTKFLFYDVPLLFENNLQTQFDLTIVVWCDLQTQLNRLIQRNHLDIPQAQLRINNQMKLSEKIRLAKKCIDNSGSEFELMLVVDQLLQNFTGVDLN